MDVGIISYQEDEESRLRCLKKIHTLRYQHFDIVMKMDSLTTETEELEIKDIVHLLVMKKEC